MADNYTILYHEILDKVHKAKSKEQKVSILRQYNTEGFRKIIKSSFDPKIEWDIPEGSVPYRVNEAPEGTEHTRLATEANKLWHFIKGADRNLSKTKREMMFIQMLEGLCQGEAEVLVTAKDKRLHQRYKGLSHAVVKEAFDWDDEYMMIDASAPTVTRDKQGNRIAADDSYPQMPGSASGA